MPIAPVDEAGVLYVINDAGYDSDGYYGETV